MNPHSLPGLAAVVITGLLVGCSTDRVAHVGEGPREEIAYAATAKYPGTSSASAQGTRVEVRQGTDGTVVNVHGADTATPAAGTSVPPAQAPAAAAPAAAPSAAANKYRVAAIDHRDDQEIELLNLTDLSVPPSAMWVNGLFVHRVPTIPSRGTLKVRYSELLEAGRPTGDLKQLDQNARKVELQIGDKLHPVDGPAVK